MTTACSKCVMDDTAPGFVPMGDEGCNFCLDYLNKKKQLETSIQSDRSLERLIDDIKKSKSKSNYNCIIGLSGGVDSSWVLVKAKQAGLNPLCVHMDNGWNSELAQQNIENLVKSQNVDYITHVINWHEYRQLMEAFFKADVLDVELLYDNAMFAVNYKYAQKFGVSTILGGTNFATEGVNMPDGWNWFKFDKRNIKKIAKLENVQSFKSFPAMGTLDFVRYEYLNGIKWVSFLDYMNFSKSSALEFLEKECGYRRYPYKHYESVFTRFYQGYILPQKFGVDKRKVHLSSLILAGDMAREEAKTLLDKIPYPSEEEQQNDVEFFLKKMGWTKGELEEYLKRPSRSHADFGTELP